LEQLKGVTILDKAIVTNSLIESVYTDFNKILLYTSLIVFLALLISYGRIELALITFIPMAVTWIWILGIMGLFGLKFNIVNIIISTFIFGLGDDFSIFITDGLSQKFKSGKDVLASHKSSIFLATVTTILGLGALIFAKHPALKSIAWLSMLGLLCVIIIGQTIQPLLYNYFIQNRKEKGFAPWTLPTLLLASVAFMYFVIGGFVLALIGFPLIYLLPFPSKAKRKYIYHVLLSNFVKSLVYMMANVRKVHINKEFADFSTPSVIISNHQSFLDILITVMQHPKIILLTNEWVYNSPFFGQVVKLGDYYPVADGAEGAIERLQKKVSEGYSIVIFPEGTRSADGKMKRFKKGAFFLAEQLNLDIQPLLLHGINHTMGKGDFMLFNGQMTLKYLPRIKPSDTTFGVGYSERTKNISQYFKDEFEKLRVEIEQPLYFKQRLEMNYVYKGPVLEWYTWKKIQLENYYKTYHEVLPRKGTITDLGCGYGYMAYMLNFICPDRIITGSRL
jgi:1-acyl-sn-glycerol-3-phosphate acyltransferase